MHRRILITVVWLCGCALDRAPIFGDPVDGGDPTLDAPLPDVPGLDAPPIDAPIDVPEGVDAPTDTGRCMDTDVTCDRIDDDCNEIYDDTGACSTTGTCVAFTVLGVAYQSCPAATGLAAWGGICRRMGPGYDLAVFQTPTDQDAVRSRLMTLGLGSPHWIGLNDFDVNGTYVWRDRVARPDIPEPGTDPAKRCVQFRVDGTYEELQCDQSAQVLCAAIFTDRAGCGGADEGTTCDGVDQDCDGIPDDGIDCGGDNCTPYTFWDRLYYECRDDFSTSDAAVECDTEMGAQLSVVEHDTERLYLVSVLQGTPWLALSQDDGRSTPTEGWHWPDFGNTYGIPPSSPIWASGEPNDANGSEDDRENCGLVEPDRGGFDDRRCTDGLDFLCERGWRF